MTLPILLKTDEINRKRRERYAKDAEYKEQVIKAQKKYHVRNKDEISEQRWTHETCDILLDHADNHKNDDDRLTTDFIADQLKKFKNKIYDDDDLELLKH